LGPSARTLAPVPQAKSTTDTDGSPRKAAATASSTALSRALASYGSRNASHWAEKPLMPGRPALAQTASRIAATTATWRPQRGRDGAGELDASGKPFPGDLEVKPLAGFGTRVTIADDDQAPGQIAKLGQCGNQHIIALARHHRANREQSRCASTLARSRRRNAVGPRPHHSEANGRYAVIGREQARSCSAGGDDATSARERRPLARAKHLRFARAQSG